MERVLRLVYWRNSASPALLPNRELQPASVQSTSTINEDVANGKPNIRSIATKRADADRRNCCLEALTRNFFGVERHRLIMGGTCKQPPAFFNLFWIYITGNNYLPTEAGLGSRFVSESTHGSALALNI